MTDPNDETQPHKLPREPLVPGPLRPGSTGSGSDNVPAGRTDVDRERYLDREAFPPDRDVDDRRPGSSLRVDPDRKPTDWREPPWFPPKKKDEDRGPGSAAIVVGLILIGVGLYFFVDRTLGIDLPDIRWSTLWPVILIVLGAIVLARSVRRA
jgi:hypothetical protein